MILPCQNNVLGRKHFEEVINTENELSPLGREKLNIKMLCTTEAKLEVSWEIIGSSSSFTSFIYKLKHDCPVYERV